MSYYPFKRAGFTEAAVTFLRNFANGSSTAGGISWNSVTGYLSNAAGTVLNLVRIDVLYLGQQNGGIAGLLALFSPTASRGHVTMEREDNASGNSIMSILFGATAGNRQVRFDDPRNATAKVVMLVTGTGAPSGIGGDYFTLYIDTATGKVYVCTTPHASSATWALIGSQTA